MNETPEPLEQTIELPREDLIGAGVWRVRPEAVERVPELSVRYPPTPIRLTVRQAD